MSLEKKYFKAPEEDDLKKDSFYKAGSLKNNVGERSDFNAPGKDDLKESSFRKAGDLGETKKKNNSFSFKKSDEMSLQEYLNSIVSPKIGRDYSRELEIMDGGTITIPLDVLKNMAAKGYNIISAEVINESIGLVSIEFEYYEYKDKAIKR